uniref:Uncharacterized protein n=1 Tax=Arundo donax TaxID=35708 RepID=A0A0A9R4Q9_ARUDO
MTCQIDKKKYTHENIVLKADQPMEFHGIGKANIRCKYSIVPILPTIILCQVKIKSYLLLIVTRFVKFRGSKVQI